MKDTIDIREKYETFLLFRDIVKNHMIDQGLSSSLASALNMLFLTTAVIIAAWLLKFLTQRIVIKIIEKLIRKSKTTYDDYVIERKVLHKAAHLVPAVVMYLFCDIVFIGYPVLLTLSVAVAKLYILFVFLWTIGSIVNVLEDIYNEFPNAKERPIKGYLQVIKIIIWFIGVLTAVSITFKVELTAVFASLGAVAAVLLLIFKDTLLGLVAGIQLSANKLIKIGDWISMPSHNADGTVIEITLNTVKVLNGDKTIASIPTYNLVSGSFLNHKGLEEAGARRIKRSIIIDVSTIQFWNKELLENLKSLPLLTDYVKELEQQLNNDLISDINQPTNLGLFMKYIELILTTNPKIRQDLTLVVRQLQPSENGIPIEIYAYSTDISLLQYESIQATIFNHVYAVIGKFELQIFQTPSGYDFSKFSLNK